MLEILFPRVYFGKDGWKFNAVIDGRQVERAISEHDAMGLAESILAAGKRRSRPLDLVEHDRRCAV